MSQYTTGEIAKLAGVTVRTVQYYDSRGILIPSELTEGGRRLYSEDDLKKLRVICFLRELDIPINSIGEIMNAPNAENVISVLLEQQLLVVEEELAERQSRKSTIQAIQKEMKSFNNFSIENLNDIAYQVKNKKKMNRVRGIVLAIGIIAELIEVSTLILGFTQGIWWPFAIGFVVNVAIATFVVCFYYRNTAYICPECHEVFKPGKWEFVFSAHTPATRKLHCGACGHHGFCVETYDSKN